MLKPTWKTWLAVWLGIQLAVGGLYALLTAQGAGGVAYWVSFAGGLLSTAWTVFGLVRWRELTWVKRVNSFVLATFGFGLAYLLFRAVDWEPGWRTAVYLYLAVVGFLLGINLLRLLLRPGHPILGVARTMVEEALRMGIALLFIIALLVMMVLLPLVLDSEDRVTYMVQRFLVYSNFVMFALLGMMTVLLAARSVSLELSSRQAHMTLTKPLARWQYLLGKWLGIMLLNAVLVGVAGVAIYGFTLTIAANPALNDLDRYAVDREVLTARLARVPDPIDTSWDRMYRNVLEEKQARDPDKFGQVGEPIGALPDAARQEIVADTISRFYTVEGGTSQDYRFTGLADAVAAADRALDEARALLRDRGGLTAAEADQLVNWVAGRPNELTAEVVNKVPPAVLEDALRVVEREAIQLVVTTDTSPEPEDKLVEFAMRINGQPFPRPAAPGAPIPRQRVPIETPHEITIPASMIAPDGTMRLTIEAPRQQNDGEAQPYLQFNYKDAQIELYYRVGSFAGNLVRAMVVAWVKLAFLAMVGLVAGSLLSFPVAALAGLVVFVTAAISGVIDESLSSYAYVPEGAGAWEAFTLTASRFFNHLGSGEVYDALRIVIRLVGEGSMLLVPSFGRFPTAEPLSTGRAIGNDVILGAVLRIGLVWTGVVAAAGLYFFSRKEIARVQV